MVIIVDRKKAVLFFLDFARVPPALRKSQTHSHPKRGPRAHVLVPRHISPGVYQVSPRATVYTLKEVTQGQGDVRRLAHMHGSPIVRARRAPPRVDAPRTRMLRAASVRLDVRRATDTRQTNEVEPNDTRQRAQSTSTVARTLSTETPLMSASASLSLAASTSLSLAASTSLSLAASSPPRR